MSSLHSLVVTLWVLVVASETGLMLVLFWRKAWREHATFTAFIAFCVMRSYLLLYTGLISKSLTAYYAIWWGAYVPQSVLLIALVLEVIQILFRPYDALPRGVLGNFVVAIFAIIVLSVAFTLHCPGRQPSDWITFLRAMDQGVSWTLLGIFMVVSGFARFLGIPWNHRVYGIVLGFAFYLSVDVAVVTLTAQIGFPIGNYLWPVEMLAFLIACSEWTYYFAHAEVPRTIPKLDEVNKIAAWLSQYVFLIESLEVGRGHPKATIPEEPVHLLLRSVQHDR